MRLRSVLAFQVRPSLLAFCLSFGLPAQEGSRRYPWPFGPQDEPRPVANAFHTIQRPDSKPAAGFGGPYLHGGIDIRMPVGTPILAIAVGTVWIYREGELDNIVLTEPEGDVWEYRHVAAGSPPPEIVAASRSGAPVEPGAVLGTVPAWWNGYHHIHLNRRSRHGSIRNPLDFLIPLRDRDPPRIRAIAFIPQGVNAPYPSGKDGVVEVAGLVDIVVEAIDFMEGATTGNPPLSFSWRPGPEGEPRRFEPFKNGLPQAGRHPIPRYPRAGAREVYLLSGPLASKNAIPRRGSQRFAVIITNVDAEGRPAASGAWNTADLPDGDCTVEVTASDHSGNVSQASAKVRISNALPPALPRPSFNLEDAFDALADAIFSPAAGARRPRLTHDFAAVYQGDEVEHAFALENPGDAPVEVFSIISPPAGRVVHFDAVLPPRGSGRLILAIATANLTPGHVESEFKVRLAAGEERSAVLQGEVQPFLHCLPETVIFHGAREGDALEAEALLGASVPFRLEGATLTTESEEIPVEATPIRAAGAAAAVVHFKAPARRLSPEAKAVLRLRARADTGALYGMEVPVEGKKE